MLRIGSPFTQVRHRSSEGLAGHETIMGERARRVNAAGHAGGAVVMMDHPANPRHPVTWFCRENYFGAGLLMEGDLEVAQQQRLRYGLAVVDEAPGAQHVEQWYSAYVAGTGQE